MHTAAPPPTRKAPSLEGDARHLAAWLEGREKLALLVLTLIYAAGAIWHAQSKPLWYDEIITVIAASAPTTAGALHAAEQTDASPPLPHLLIHFAIGWFGKSDVAVRIPSMAAFWIFCLCMYRYVRRRAGILYGLAALLLPMGTDAYAYSVEARGYAPELAFCGLALIGWQAAAAHRKRAWGLAALAAGMAGAMLCHYYAVLLYVPLGGAELYRWCRRREPDWFMGLAMATGALPLAWRLSRIVQVVHGFTHTWARPYPEQIPEFWETGLQHSASFAVLLAGLLALTIIAGKRQYTGEWNPPEIPDHELLAGVLFLVIPAIGVAGALFVTHSLALRYLLPALAGSVLLTPLIAACVTGGRALPAFLLLVAATLCLGYVTLEAAPRQDPFAAEPVLENALRREPVVIPDGQLFLQMWYYAPAPLKSRLLFLADDEAAHRYMGFDTIDGGLRTLRPWAPVRVVEYRDFAAPGRQFLIYQNELRPGWLLSKVIDEGGTAEIRSYSTFRALLQVHLKP
ncbi:MAG TPA: glycosyltransferase family 39 protein [Bryobacteraceae bacterium]|nr:glycosyltransferase family 39 protein [Bryobacteraceae bacterium]